MDFSTKYDVESNFTFQQGEAVLIETGENIVQTGIVISPVNTGIADEITVHTINFQDYHDTHLVHERAVKTAGFNPVERCYTYSNIKISFLNVKDGKIKLYKVAAVEPVFVGLDTRQAAQDECDRRNRERGKS